MPLSLYHSDEDTFHFRSYLGDAQTIAPWIVWSKQTWPRNDNLFGDGIAVSTVDQRVAENLAKWARRTLKAPALVFLSRPLFAIESTVPPTGFTHSEAPAISFVTTSFPDRNIDTRVVSLTAAHELLHMAHNLENAHGTNLDETRHCTSDNCLLNAKRDGDYGFSTEKSESFILQRSNNVCPNCRQVIDKVRLSAHWSS